MNVLRQYDEDAALAAWAQVCGRLGPGGVLVEGTCDEVGRLGSWVLLDADGPVSLTLSCAVVHLDHPRSLAERLPKALIHHNVPGQAGADLFIATSATAWDAAAPLAVVRSPAAVDGRRGRAGRVAGRCCPRPPAPLRRAHRRLVRGGPGLTRPRRGTMSDRVLLPRSPSAATS